MLLDGQHHLTCMFVYLSSLLLLGIITGSFVSAISYRIPKGIGFVKGRSFCDSCKKDLYWYDNIPLLSFFLYLGRSRCCKKQISIRYPLIEIASALGAVLIFFTFGFNTFLIYYPLFLVSLTIFVIDLEHQIIPDELSLIVFLFGLLNLYVYGSNMGAILYQSLLSGFVFSLLLLLLHLVTKGRGMGLGDVKLAIGLGLILGFSKGLTWLMLSFLTGGIIASILLISGKAKLKTKIAFGPFLIFAFWLTLFIIK